MQIIWFYVNISFTRKNLRFSDFPLSFLLFGESSNHYDLQAISNEKLYLGSPPKGPYCITKIEGNPIN